MRKDSLSLLLAGAILGCMVCTLPDVWPIPNPEPPFAFKLGIIFFLAWLGSLAMERYSKSV